MPTTNCNVQPTISLDEFYRIRGAQIAQEKRDAAQLNETRKVTVASVTATSTEKSLASRGWMK